MEAPRQDSMGRYELLIELGRGGMAELFLGRLQGAGGFAKLVAIKRILPHLAQDKQFKEMFLNEGRIAAHLSHPNVCQVFELDEVDDELFLAMEYLDGVSWDHLVRELPRDAGSPESAPDARLSLTVGVLAQAAEGLHYAHGLRDIEGQLTPVIHRDVSPQNLFVTIDGVCKVLDFGVSKMMTDGPRTRSGVIKGKLPYMAPEQIRGEELDARADVFALGVCAWEALAGVRLFERATDFMIGKAITEEDVPSITTHWPDCPPAVDAVIRRALDRDRERRQATARELGTA
ncbi:MAG: serine/threonine protein kinase, partial [Myxococcota bacterium]|nr:serine/threonine protein kinase [Myxococcota bacterium]